MKTSSVDTPDALSAGRIEGTIEHRSDEILDLRGVTCPMNLVRVKLALEQIRDGATLQVVIDTGEPMRSIPRAAKEEGHKIIDAGKFDGGGFSLLIQKGGRD